jgi:hypothetical protein
MKNPLALTSKYIESRSYRIPESELRVAALLALESADFRNIQVSQSGYLRAQTQISLWSYSENIQVSFEDARKGTAVLFVSVCALPFQFFAFGKNKRNAASFFHHLQLQLEKPAVGK